LSPPALSVVIVNWNGGALLERCLASLAPRLEALDGASEVIVVDNGSTDDSLLAAELTPRTVVLRNGCNLGFGRACNLGARAATGRHLLFLNPDCEVRPGSIERCLAELRAEDVGACGIALADESGRIARSCHRFPRFGHFCLRILGLAFVSSRLRDSAMNDWDHARDADVDHVIGAFYALRREVFERVGGFDERFFMYLEDLDLSLRIHRHGLRIRFLAAPASFHLGGGVSRQIKARRLFYATRSRILYAFKHFAPWQAWLHLALTLALEPLTRGVLALARGSVDALRETGAGFALLWRDLPATLRLAARP
jgi:GT2 family glycosyltransferase